jgi:hypothetical protein
MPAQKRHLRRDQHSGIDRLPDGNIAGYGVNIGYRREGRDPVKGIVGK